MSDCIGGELNATYIDRLPVQIPNSEDSAH